MTRGERRPVHITLIATCRVYNSVVVIRRITPGLSPGYENPTAVESTIIPSCETWAGAVVRFSRPRSTCAHGEYSEYPASTLVPRPDY